MLCLLCAALGSSAQTPVKVAPTDTSAQASPATVSPSISEPTVDTSAQASPVASDKGHRVSVPAHTAIAVQLAHGIDSGQLKNGQRVLAALSAPVNLPTGHFPAGTPVEVTVIATVEAGKIAAAGEFSLQLLRVGKVAVSTEVQTFHGTPGHKDLPDSAADVGTNAGLPGGAILTFHVQPTPVAASGPPKQGVDTPGSITQHVGGSAGTPRPANAGAGAPQSGQTPAGAVPANTTSTPIHTATPSNAVPTQGAPVQPR